MLPALSSSEGRSADDAHTGHEDPQNIVLSERNQTHANTLYDWVYMKFKDQENESVGIEISFSFLK